MPSYRVCFINQIPRGPELFRCCQRSLVIRRARSPERAVRAAKKRFARLEGIRNWRIHAGIIEVQEIDPSAPGSTQPHPFQHGPPGGLRTAPTSRTRPTAGRATCREARRIVAISRRRPSSARRSHSCFSLGSGMLC